VRTKTSGGNRAKDGVPYECVRSYETWAESDQRSRVEDDILCVREHSFARSYGLVPAPCATTEQKTEDRTTASGRTSARMKVKKYPFCLFLRAKVSGVYFNRPFALQCLLFTFEASEPINLCSSSCFLLFPLPGWVYEFRSYAEPCSFYLVCYFRRGLDLVW
jgi:hypothetical protein